MRRIWSKRGAGEMKGRKAPRRAGIVLVLAALFGAGALVSGAFGMALVGDGTTDSTTTVSSSTDTTPTPTDTTSTSTPTDTTSTTTTTAEPPSPTITSDQDDYAAGATVTLTGDNWSPGESVHIFVNDSIGQTWNHSNDVTAGPNGGFTVQFQLSTSFISNYTVTATGTVSGPATTTFTDAKITNNGVTVGSPITATVAPGNTATFGTVSVNLNGNNSPSCSVTLGTVTQSGDSGLPAGVTANFGNSPFNSTGGTVNSSFSLTTAAAVSPGTYTFHVTATDGTGCQDTATEPSQQQLTLNVVKRVGAVSIGSQTGTLTSGTAGSSTYLVTVTRNGGTPGTAFNAALTLTTSLPTGATASFSPSTVTFGANDASKTSTLTISSNTATPAGSTSFTVKAENTVLSGDSATGNGTLTVGTACTAPTVTTQPTNQTITYGANATFTAAASGTPAPTVKWQVSTNGGASWSDVPGATSTTFTLTQPSASLSGNKYRAIFTNTCGGTPTATTSEATLTVNKANQTITFGALPDKTLGTGFLRRSLRKLGAYGRV